MKPLAQFIREEQERILEEFEEFARTHTTVGSAMDIPALRDHAAAMLSAIALDMEEPQSDADEARKSKGCAPKNPQAADTAAESHGTDRADHGFTLQEMISEYRALRASVLRLWTTSHGSLGKDGDDLIRFNEAIDMAMTESLPTFSDKLAQSREMFLAVLGHDLRTPLGAVVTASSFLASNGGLTGRNLNLAQRIHSSGRRMDDMIADLVDLTRYNLGSGIPVAPEEMDLGEMAREAIDETRSAYPMSDLRFEESGNVCGEWDPSRVYQALLNLMGNAVQHGDGSTPIAVTARGDAADVVISIHNHGNVIEPEEQDRIFEPFERIEPADGERCRLRSSGLGLHIAKKIALAHGGSIEVRSTVEEGTTFELHLPRAAPAE